MNLDTSLFPDSLVYLLHNLDSSHCMILPHLLRWVHVISIPITVPTRNNATTVLKLGKETLKKMYGVHSVHNASLRTEEFLIPQKKQEDTTNATVFLAEHLPELVLIELPLLFTGLIDSRSELWSTQWGTNSVMMPNGQTVSKYNFVLNDFLSFV